MDKTFTGDIVAEKGVVYEYTKITGYIDASGADTKTAFPKLTSVGGSIDARGDWSHVKQYDGDAITHTADALLNSFSASGFSLNDNILARIISRRGNVLRVIICGATEVSYVVTDGEVWSHGATLREARDGLLFKIGKRDPSEFKTWTLSRVVSRRDAIRAYRVITGACEQGVRMWVSQRELPEKSTVRNVIRLTKWAYGSDVFCRFFTDK